MNRSKPKVESLLQRTFQSIHHLALPTFPCVISLKLLKLNPAVCWLIPAKALEILSFFHSQGWSYSSGGRSSSCGSRLSLGQRERSGSESPPFSAGSYGVSYRGSCLADPSFSPLPVPPDRISKKKKNRTDWSLPPVIQPFVGLHLHLSQNVSFSAQTCNHTEREPSVSTLSSSTSSSPPRSLLI